MKNRQITIAELPKGELAADHFKQVEADMPVPGEGEVLLRVVLMSIDAANRSWMKLHGTTGLSGTFLWRTRERCSVRTNVKMKFTFGALEKLCSCGCVQ